jgi:hypothetical protein
MPRFAPAGAPLARLIACLQASRREETRPLAACRSVSAEASRASRCALLRMTHILHHCGPVTLRPRSDDPARLSVKKVAVTQKIPRISWRRPAF